LFSCDCRREVDTARTTIESENRHSLRGTEMPEPNCWYVSYAVKSDRDPRRYARVTRTFDSEEHAKLFVREIAVDYLRLAAGTINPHSPKRVVSAAEIAGWLEAHPQFPVSDDASRQAPPSDDPEALLGAAASCVSGSYQK
jgi:hypothetical protein